MKARHFCARLLWEIEEGVNVTVTVRGTITPYIPATQWEPAEGAELEDLEIVNERGCPLPQDVADHLGDDEAFLEAVIRAANDADDGPDWDSLNDEKREVELLRREQGR